MVKDNDKSNESQIVIIGAGPAGLAAAYKLAVENGKQCVILEKSSSIGGLCETVKYHGYRMDIGPHRFFTKNQNVSELWQKVLGDDFKLCERQTRIYYNNIFFNYPLKPTEIPFKLGLLQSFYVGMSYIKRHLFPIRPEDNFNSWVRNRFGDRLYDIFFHDYTKKVWGIEPEDINADWAAQRIRSLSLAKVVFDMLKLLGKGNQTSLISQFYYPRLGAGQMYEAMAEKIEQAGVEIIFNAKVTDINIENGKAGEVIYVKDGKNEKVAAQNVISSMPLDELALAINNSTEKVQKAAEDLTYRSLVTVDLMFDDKIPVNDHWIYLNSPDVKAGRMNLFQNWSKDMMPAENHSCISLEYFCFESDPEWKADDKTLFELARQDLNKIDFMKGLEPCDQTVVRYSKAYPCYFGHYMEDLKTIRNHIDSIGNVIPVGRYGQFRYNNMDHSIETGLLAARKVMGENVNPWAVNEEAEYHEEGGEKS